MSETTAPDTTRPVHSRTEARVPPPKIFGIGLNKTGTTSLHAALEALGFTSLHWGGPAVYREIVRAHREGLPLLHHLPEHDAIMDVGWLSANFHLADEQYPGSKFILTTRDIDGWLDSRQRHVEKNIVRKAEGRYDGNFLTVDRTKWWHEYRTHHRKVMAYFDERPDDLLVLDICAGDGYELLCPFLGVPTLDEPFPFQNRDRATDRDRRATAH